MYCSHSVTDGPAAVGVGLRPVADLMAAATGSAAPTAPARRSSRAAPAARRAARTDEVRRTSRWRSKSQPIAVQHAAGVVAGDGPTSRHRGGCEKPSGRARELGVPKRLRLLRRPAPARPLSGRGIAGHQQGDHRAMHRAPPRRAGGNGAGHTCWARRLTSSASTTRACRHCGPLPSSSSIRALVRSTSSLRGTPNHETRGFIEYGGQRRARVV